MLKYLDGPDGEPKPEKETPTVSPPNAETELPSSSTEEDINPDELETIEHEGATQDAVVGDEDDPEAVLKQKIEGLEQRIGYLERIVKVSQMLNSTLSLEPLLQIIVHSATELTNTEACSIMLIDKNTGELRFEEASGGITDALKQVSVPLDNSIAGSIIRKDRPLLIRDAKNDPRWHGGVDETVDFETKSILGVPLKVRDRVIGVMEVINKRTEEGFNADDIQIATTLASQAAIAIENARLLDELQSAYRDLAEVDQLKNDFVSVASHELRTPLAVILGYATFLRDEVKGEASEQLEIVLSSALKLRSLIDDMVNLRHIQADEIRLDRTIFSFKELVLEVIAELKQITSSKGLTLTKKFIPNDSPLNLDADRQKIYLVMANLVNNAIKFTPEGGRIHINVELKNHKYWISVIDTGIGIPKEEFNRIFDQFHQVEDPMTRKYQGMGIGLSITKGMVDVHKGRIWVESIVGKGSKFTVVLPTAPDVQDT